MDEVLSSAGASNRNNLETANRPLKNEASYEKMRGNDISRTQSSEGWIKYPKKIECLRIKE